jgi:hypothetical protein
MGAGRPTKYRKTYCQELVTHMASGLSFESFAGAIGTCKQTLYSWANEFTEFMDAKKIGFEQNRLFWEKLGINNIINRKRRV